jgi:hypothetical protein
MRRIDCRLPSETSLPTTLLPTDVEAQLEVLSEDRWETRARCRLCGGELTLRREDYHVLHTVFPTAPCARSGP